MKLRPVILFVCLLSIVYSCNEEAIPKPKAQIRLEYPEGKNVPLETENFKFEYNEFARADINKNSAFTLEYPEMKGAIFLSYKKVEGDIDKLIIDAKKLSYEHAIKADNIVEQPYINPDKKVYGALFEVQGNAASQSQFFVTDSTEHFLTGSVYFYAKPNYDSILPAAAYLQNDMRRIIETLEWK
ncbi:gliding motility lipoprotein GldD [Maribacter thermophilus]|uniref:gliding motility lipoprotein GldD n=1 Tax=Maribacter thermophilus TaxID=1197874 RepID=UPI0006410703|nr:gliding motility lipoprotein GldD [Maribacter thermophilus]